MEMNVRSFGTRMTPMLLFLFFIVLHQTHAILFEIPNEGLKCVSEEIHSNVVVLANYYVIGSQEHPEYPSINIAVTSPYGNTLHHKENATYGDFAFTTTETGTYMACFKLAGNAPPKGITISLVLDWKIGISAKDWDAVAKKEKLEGVELELVKLEESIKVIYEFLGYLKEKETHMMEVSENTNAKVFHYTLMSVGVCILVSGLQVWRLKHFFQKKKLI